MKIEAAAAESAMPGRWFLSMHNVVFHGCRKIKTASMSADVTMIARSRLAVTRYISRAVQVANKMPTIGDATLASSVDRTVPSLLTIAHPAASVRAKKSSPTMPNKSTPCLLYTSDAADDLTRVDLGGRR